MSELAKNKDEEDISCLLKKIIQGKHHVKAKSVLHNELGTFVEVSRADFIDLFGNRLEKRKIFRFFGSYEIMYDFFIDGKKVYITCYLNNLDPYVEKIQKW